MIEIGLKHTSVLTVTDTVTAIKMGLVTCQSIHKQNEEPQF